MPRLILAPLRGVTDWPFRAAVAKHFPGFIEAVAPFINPQKPGGKKPAKLAPLSDLLPEQNHLLPVTPQLLDNDAESFVAMAGRLRDLGYTRLNWNLGCPAPMVTHKGRGAAMLTKPDEICALLDFALPRLDCRLSLKTRLGMRGPGEILILIERLNGYPLEELIIHPRLGSQLFRGQCDVEGFAAALSASRHPVVYNGDITSVADFQRLAARFPEVSGWMIGRGAVARPMLAEEIMGGPPAEPPAEPPAPMEPSAMPPRLAAFHDELYAVYEEKLSGPGHLLGKMKQLWIYFIASFPGRERLLKKIVRARGPEGYQAAVREIFGRD